MLRIDARSSREIQAILFGLAGLPREVRKQIRSATKGWVGPEWTEAVRGNTSTRLESRVLADTSRVTVSDRNIRLSSGTVGRKLSGGFNPKTQTSAVEFGADRNKKVTYDARSSKGKRYSVTRRTRAQFRPANRKGYAVYPAASNIIPRVGRAWAQTIVRSLHEALEGKAR